MLRDRAGGGDLLLGCRLCRQLDVVTERMRREEEQDEQAVVAQLGDQQNQYWLADKDPTKSPLYWRDRQQLLFLIGKLTSAPEALRLASMGVMFVVLVIVRSRRRVGSHRHRGTPEARTAGW